MQLHMIYNTRKIIWVISTAAQILDWMEDQMNSIEKSVTYHTGNTGKKEYELDQNGVQTIWALYLQEEWLTPAAEAAQHEHFAVNYSAKSWIEVKKIKIKKCWIEWEIT